MLARRIILPEFATLSFHNLTNPFSRNSFLFTSIQIPRGVTSSTLNVSSFRCAFRVPNNLPDPQTRQPFCLQWLAASLGLLALFCEPRSFVFNSLQPLLPKCGGWGIYLLLPTFRCVFTFQNSKNRLSHPLRQYREPIAPTCPRRHHCQDAPNRILVRRPSPSR